MELIGHKTEPAAVPAMVGADLFQTQDVEEARQWGVRTFCENRLKKVDGMRPINARMNLRKVRGVGFGRMTYGGAVDIDPGCLDSFYLLQVPLSGREVIDTGGQTVCSSGKVGSVINATGASLIRHEANTEKLIVRVEREVLERNCIQHLGHALRQPIGFLPAMTLDGTAGSRWTSLLRWIYESLALDEQCFDSPMMSAQVEQTVIATLPAFRCSTSHWPGTRPRRATFFLVVRQERRQRNVPRCRAPFGGALLPGPSGGVCANSPCGLKHAQPFFRLPNPPVGAPEGRGNAGDQRPVPDSSSAGARCIRKARSDPPSSAPAGGEVRRGCLSPKGEFRAGRLLGAAQGSHSRSE
jgi:hypothetical protein